MIEINKLTKTYENGFAALRGVSLTTAERGMLAIVGSSGSGKSTLLNVLACNDTFEEGSATYNGKPYGELTQAEKSANFAYIYQDYKLIENITVFQNIKISAELAGCADDGAINAVLAQVGLGDKASEPVLNLSGGQKQRVAIARAIIRNPKVIFADEPTGNLDSVSSKEIIALLGEISKEKLVVVVTHNFEDVEQFATRHIRIFDGSVQSDDTLRPYTPCAETKARNAILTRKQIWRDSAALGLTKYKARPKLSVFLTLIMTIACVIVCVVTSLCSMPFQVIEENSYALSRMKGRTLVTRADGAQMTQEEKTKL
ncbi:MAG: ABC transporter ATP-binding protein, partial [Clostridia bacterium]